MEKYRRYVDETGNSDLVSSDDPNHRYLGLTGVAITLDHISDIVFPELEKLKKSFFPSHPDEPIVLHRKEMVNHRYPFECLAQESIRTEFNKNLLLLLENWEFTIITVLIDKFEHKQRYSSWQFDPYHYGLMVMIERYVLFLEENNSVGDVMAESRGGKDDRRLKDSFERLLARGTEYVPSERFSNSLTSKQLKVKPKMNNIAGLQIADIVAHPCRRDMMRDVMDTSSHKSEVFGDKIIGILQQKYYQKNGKANGYGKKMLP